MKHKSLLPGRLIISLSKVIIATATVCFISSCCKEDETTIDGFIGETTVDLNANRDELRQKETNIGNLIADAILTISKEKDPAINFAVINGGSIRFNSERKPEGIYAKGALSNQDVEDILPFGNSSVVVIISGKELKEVFERSVSEVDRLKGQFLQISKNVQIVVDLSKQAQILDQTVEPNIITVAGNRIESIKIAEKEVIDSILYKVVFSDFLVEGNDGFVTLSKIEASRKNFLNELQVDQLRDYIILNTPVSPVIENRIIIR